MGSRVTIGLLVCVTAGSLALTASFTHVSAAPRPVIVAEYDGIIHPVAVEFFDEVMARADTSDAAATVLILRTPGGLLDSTRTIVSRMIASRTPVVVFVAPSGARAASAGFIIAIAADVVAMAPGTHIGAAHPVSVGGEAQKGDETTANKAAADTAAYARTLAAARQRNVTFAAEAVLQRNS
jgi:membrane-bound serine protease (ClpP class)